MRLVKTMTIMKTGTIQDRYKNKREAPSDNDYNEDNKATKGGRMQGKLNSKYLVSYSIFLLLYYIYTTDCYVSLHIVVTIISTLNKHLVLTIIF